MDKSRRKRQRQINRIVKQVNKSIERDALWRGRFFMRQWAATWERYDDHSGGKLTVILNAIDKKTNKAQKFAIDNYSAYWAVPRAMNDFIVEICKVWENENPYDDTTDYRKVIYE